MAITLDGTNGISTPDVEPTGSTVPTNGLYLPAANSVGIATGGSERVRTDSSGNVGIGTSSPSYKLDVRSTLAVLDGSSNIGFYANGTTYTQVWQTFQSPNDLLIKTTAAKYIAFLPNSAEAMRIDASGNLLFNSGYGSVATAYGCRAWVNFNGTGAVAIRASGNVSSITDNGTGSYTVNFTTAMPDRNYSVTQCAGNVSTNACYLTSFYTPATGSVRLLCRSDAAATIDADECNVAIFR